jgi:hypothetical protein
VEKEKEKGKDEEDEDRPPHDKRPRHGKKPWPGQTPTAVHSALDYTIADSVPMRRLSATIAER